jgi:hypothetical protein
MMFMNQWEIEEAVCRRANDPVLGPATVFLEKFMHEVNAHSDGWAYWSAPVNAAKQLMQLIKLGYATEAQYRKALGPIKSFMTRRGKAAGMVMPT